MASEELFYEQEIDLVHQDVLGYRIYGDNIEECTKFGEMLMRVGEKLGLVPVRVLRPYSEPIYVLRCTEEIEGMGGTLIAFHVCGRYGEWSLDRRPFVGNEDPDVILTYVGEEGGAGKPILSVEFNDAIPAGNNAWQRFPRIAQAAEANIPSIYGIPVCDAEVFGGELRSLRHPNVAIPLGQMILMARYRVASLAIYSESPWYRNALDVGLASNDVDGSESDLRIGGFALLQALLAGAGDLGANPDKARAALRNQERQLFTKCLNDMLLMSAHFIDRDFTLLKDHPLLEAANRTKVIDAWWKRITEGTEVPKQFRFYEWDIEELKAKGFPFSKATSTRSRFKDRLNPRLKLLSTASKAETIEFAELWNIRTPEGATRAEIVDLVNRGPESWKRPLSYKLPANEVGFIFNVEVFARLLRETYPDLEASIVDRCRNAPPPLLFLPIAGYVEDSGGVIAFSRPDKGLAGLMATVFGGGDEFRERLVLMYHQEIPETWLHEFEQALRENQGLEIERAPNNLWRETARLATIVVVDHLQEGWSA